MNDNRFAMMRVNRSGTTSRSGHGNEAVPTRLQGTRIAAAQRDAHVGARCGPGRGSAHAGSQPADGIELGQEAGRGSTSVAAQAVGTPRGFGRGAEKAAWQSLAGRGGGQRVSDRTVDAGAGGQVDRARVRGGVQHGQRLAHPARVGVLQPTSGGARHPARRSGDQAVAQQALAGAKKKSRREGRTIVFIDESGLSERPTRVKTWAPKGQTPVLQYSFNWKQLSVIAGISFWNFYFRLHAGAIRGPQFVEFLQALTKQIRGKLLIIWDGLPAHRSRLVKDYVESLDGHLVLERLPAYAPELNPAEYIWGYMKQRELANLCLHTIGEVSTFARNRLKSMQRRPQLITAFWQQAELPI